MPLAERPYQAPEKRTLVETGFDPSEKREKGTWPKAESGRGTCEAIRGNCIGKMFYAKGYSVILLNGESSGGDVTIRRK